MGACESRPKTLENDAPVELPVVGEETPVATSKVTPAESSVTMEVETESSENINKTEEKEAALIDLSEPEAEESKSKEVALEPKVEEETSSPKETEGEAKEENMESATENVAKETEEKVAAESEIAGKKPTEEKEAVEAKQTQPEEEQ